MSEEKKHADMSPSGADRWMTCPGSVHLCKGVKSPDSSYSIEGTDYHDVAAACLENAVDAASMIGCEMLSGALVTEENAAFVQTYLDIVRQHQTLLHGTLLIEEKAPLAVLTGEPDAYGTSDCVVIADETLVIGDLKFGQGEAVNADHNRQTMIYALGVLYKHDLWGSVSTVVTFISQPRIQGQTYSEHSYTIPEMRAFEQEVREAAKAVCTVEAIVPGTPIRSAEEMGLHPSAKACRWCVAKAFCPALRDTVEEGMQLGFKDEQAGPLTPTGMISPITAEGDRLGSAMDLTDLAEIWITGVRSAVEVSLLTGRSVIGKDGPYKLVEGRKGARQWSDEEAAELMFRKLRVKKDHMYTMKLISPTGGEKLFKGREEVWEKFTALVKQNPPSKSVANAKDPRPGVVVAPAAGFVDEGVEDLL